MEYQSDIVQEAAKMAQKVHENHLRKSGETYFEHANRIVHLLSENGVNDEEILISAYLHHVLNVDEKYSSEVAEKFGDHVLQIIQEYKEISQMELPDVEAKLNEKNIVQTYLNLVKNPKVLIIRLTDKVDNIKSLYALSSDSAKKVARKALFLYSPICHLLGLNKYVKVLEDEAFKTLNPAEYFIIKNLVDEELMEIQDILADVSDFILQILEENKVNAKVDYRVKHVFSVYKKLNKYNLEYNSSGIKKLHDLAAMRILVNTVEDCYKVEDILKQVWQYNADRRNDYIQSPKSSGYRSIHTEFMLSQDLWTEVQIKTYEMHENNEFGFASHAFYKIGENLKKQMLSNPEFLKELSFDINKESIRIDHFSNMVYVFTPKGEIKELPKGSNLVDFAYAVHNDLGNRCVGGMVNGEYAKLSQELKDGDRVEIKIDKRRQRPSSDWLDIVKTKRAKDEIRKSLRETNI